ncbi:MAG TPA: SH3 domain-containing protein [Rudaea sp.]|jgi:uncharacterized protein YraI
MKRILLTAIAGISLAAAATAFAAEGYVTANVSLRAGPDTGYPAVMGLRAGTPVFIEGCVDGWAWCDVSLGDDRGWVSGAYLQEEYDGRRVLVRDYGVRIGIPIVSFVFGDYWDHYYRGRSWYGNRERYSHVQPRYYHGGSYGHAGAYGHSGSAYAHGPVHQDLHRESHPTYSGGMHGGAVATHGVAPRHDGAPVLHAQHGGAPAAQHVAPQRNAAGPHGDKGSQHGHESGKSKSDRDRGGGH